MGTSGGNKGIAPGSFWVTSYGAKGNGKAVGDGAMSSSVNTTTLTSATAGFTAADVGKVIIVNGAGAAGVPLSTTISTFTNATTVILAAAAATTVSNASVVWGTDDSAAINSAVSAAVTSGVNNYGEVFFPPGIYMVAAATTKGGATQGNAQIPLPVIATGASQKFALSLTGAKDGSSWVHWDQSIPQTSGATIVSTLVGQTLDGTWGAPSIIGGPTVAVNGSDTYSNMRITVDGLRVMAPYNPSVVGFDFKFLAQMHIKTASALAFASTAGGTPLITTVPTNSIGMGLRSPSNGNNDANLVWDYGCQGFYYGLQISEHFSATRIACVYTNVGMIAINGGGSFHGASIVNYNAEATTTALQMLGTGGSSFPLNIDAMSVETITTDIDDASNLLRGQINWNNIANTAPVTSGAGNVRIVSCNNSNGPGAKTPPGVPATTVALVNPFWRDAAVTITGGAVTVVKVDATTTNLVPPCTVYVPTGKSIALTYTSAPTWVWVTM